MSKIILVLRHAQSAGKQGGQQDYDRELTVAGIAAARDLGKKLANDHFHPDLILASAALRTRRTTEIVNEALQVSGDKIEFKKELYEASASTWLEQIQMIPAEVKSILIVGHNPYLSLLASEFAGQMLELAPCELIGFQFNSSDWREINSTGKVILRLQA